LNPLKRKLDWTDICHAVLGFLCAICRKLCWWTALALFIAFAAYEALQEEPKATTYEDCVEFLVGFALGLILLP
jgi:hypothetical protein